MKYLRGLRIQYRGPVLSRLEMQSRDPACFCLDLNFLQVTASDFHASHSGYHRERLNHDVWIRSETAPKVSSGAEVVCPSETISCFREFRTVKTVPAEQSKKGQDKDV